MEPRPRISLSVTSLPAPLQRGLAAAYVELFERPDHEASPTRRVGRFVGRLVWLVTRGFFQSQLQLHASSLAFVTILAFVPALAFAFAVADLLGATDALIEQTLVPFLDQTFGRADDESLPGGVRGLRSTADSLLRLVRATDVSGLGFTGFIVMLLAVIRVLAGVEEAFAHIFQHEGPPRSLVARIRAFLLVLSTLPLGLSYAVASAVLSHANLHARLGRFAPFAPLIDALLLALPPVVVALSLFLLYRELPDAKVSVRTAVFGASLSALAWYGTQLLHIRFQVGLAGWDAIYSGFGAFPILMVEIQLSWVIVLLGAQVISALEDAPALRLAHDRAPDHVRKQALAIQMAMMLARNDTTETPLRELATQSRVTVRTARTVMEDLVAHGLAQVNVKRTDRFYALRVKPEELHASRVLDAIESAPPDAALPWHDQEEAIRSVLRSRRDAASSSMADQTIASLIDRLK